MEKIQQFRDLLNLFSNNEWQVIAGEVLAEIPPYPFIETFIINYSPDFHNQSIEIVKNENREITEQNFKTYNATLQFNCRHRTIEESLALSEKLYRLINFEKRLAINNAEIGIKNMSNIRNLNYNQAGKWSYCYSFDVEISFDVIEAREVETIETVITNINNTEVKING